MSLLNSPLLLGFDHFERLLERAAKAGTDGYPPYNIKALGEDRLRITLAVAGFTKDDLGITVEHNQLLIRGRQAETETGTLLHRGIAARGFQRTFILAEGIEVTGAELENGLLHVDLVRPEPPDLARTIEIRTADESTQGPTTIEAEVQDKSA